MYDLVLTILLGIGIGLNIIALAQTISRKGS